MEERKRCFPTAIKLKFSVRMSTRRYMNLVVRRNHESRSTHSDGLRSTLKWLRSRILFIIREWTHGNKPIAARDFDWRQIVNLNQLQLIAQCAVTLFCFSPSSFSFFRIYLQSFFLFFVHFLLFMFVCLKKVDFFLLQINICRSYNLICLLMYLDCIVLFKFIWVHFILSYFYLAFSVLF